MNSFVKQFNDLFRPISLLFSPFSHEQPFGVFFKDVLHKENYMYSLSPNMIHFNAVDFSECHSRDVINFF